MGSKLLPAGLSQKGVNDPLGPGVVLYDVVSYKPADILSIINGDTAMGKSLGLLSAAPTFSVSQDTVNMYDNVVGLNARLLGSEQLSSQEVTIECEFININKSTLALAMPGLSETDWMGDTNALLVTGTGNAAFKTVALAGGTGGNAISITVGTPAGTGAPQVVVTVTGSAISLAVKTTATANDAVAAINSHAAARALVQAGLPTTSNGTGVLLAQVSTPLAGGAAGTRIGGKFQHRGFWDTSNRLRNVAIVLESNKSSVAHVFSIRNAISMDDFEYSAEDDQVLAGVGMTFSAENSDDDYDAAVGNYRAPFTLYRLDDVA